MTLRLPAGEVTVLLGEQIVRRRLMDMLDDSSGRGASGASVTVHRVSAGTSECVAARRRRLAEAGDEAAIVLVDHITDGLDAAGRRAVLGALATVAARGAAVLVDDDDCVAALAMADGTLRPDPVRGLVLEPANGSAVPLEELYRAS